MINGQNTKNENGYPRLMAARRASKASGVSEHLIRKLIADGVVKTVTSGNRKYINMESLFEYISRGDTAKG